MAETKTTRFKLPQWSQGTDPYPGRTGWNNILKLLEDQAAIAFPSGPISSRPQSGTFGRFFLATDQGTPQAPASRLYYDSGTGWVELNTNGGGGPGTAIAIGGSASEGTSNRSARADHVHSFPFASTNTAGALSPQHFDLLEGAAVTATNGMLVKRTSSGNVVVPPTPGGANDATSKTYVDNITADIRAASHLVKPGELVRRWSGSGSTGTIHLPDPTAPSDGCNKRYADALGSSSVIPSEIVRRWSSADAGAISGPDPGKPEFYATKRYVDSRVSRKEWKENPRAIPYGLDEVVALARKARLYDYKNTDQAPLSVRGEKDHLGAYVEDVHAIMPLLTVAGEDERPERVTDRELIWPAYTAIAQLEERDRAKDSRIAALVSENASLHDRIHRIEAHLGI